MGVSVIHGVYHTHRKTPYKGLPKTTLKVA
jgi:hypothetical protein